MNGLHPSLGNKKLFKQFQCFAFMLKFSILKFILFIGDIFFVYAALFLALALRYRTFEFLADTNYLNIFLRHFTFIYIFWLLFLYIFDFYETQLLKNKYNFQRNLIAFLILAFSSGVIYFYFRPQIGIAPKTILALNVIIFTIFLAGWRYLNFIFLLKNNNADFESSKKISLEDINEDEFKQYAALVGDIDSALKKLIDFFAGAFSLLVNLALFPIIAVAIKLTSPGPIFYSQKRVGKDGKIFTLYKFRTMVQDAEKEGPRWAKEKDERVTKIGNILRRTHLDELPQAINLLRGDISLVGPRPERPEFVAILEKEIPHYRLRELVKPGIVGWAQLNFPYGDSIEDAREKLKYDLYYIKNRSILFDIIITLKSIKITLFARGQ